MFVKILVENIICFIIQINVKLLCLEQIKILKILLFTAKQYLLKNKVKHLGNYLNNNTTDLFDFKNLISDLKIRTNVLLSNFRFLETKSRRNIHNSYCNNFYGCELTNLMSKNLIDLEDGV